MGYDLEGNMYFESPNLRQREGINNTRRTVIYSDGRNALSQYNPDALPIQWQAWLRHTRNDAPTVAELEAEVARLDYIGQKVKLLEHESEAVEASQVTKPIGRIEQPSFEPQAWNPSPQKRQ